MALLAPKPSGLPLWSALPGLLVLMVQTAQRVRKATQALPVLIAPCLAPLVLAHTR